MTFSEQFIEVFNFLASQIGIIIDWTSENVVPYMQDFSSRFVRYEIAKSATWIIIMIIIPLILFALAKMATKEHREADYYSEGILMFFAWMFFGISCVTSLIVISSQVFHIIKAVNIPEQLIIEELLQIKRMLGY